MTVAEAVHRQHDPRDKRDAAQAAGEFVRLCRDLPMTQGLAASRVLQDGDNEGGAVRRSARTRRPPELYDVTVLDAVLDEVLERDTEWCYGPVCNLWMLN